MEVSKETPFILGRPFLSTAAAHIDVGVGEICFNINGKEETFPFRPKKEQCSLINIKSRPSTLEKAEATSPNPKPTPTRSTKTTKKVWHKVACSSSSNSLGQAEQW